MLTVKLTQIELTDPVLSEYWAAANPESPKAGVG